MVRAALPLLAALAGSAVAAETTTVKILVLGDESPLVGSVVNADSSATTFAVQCPSGTPSDECGLPPDGATITQGESTWQWNYGMSNSELGVFTQKANCKLDPSKDVAACSVEITEGSQVTSSETTESGYKTSMFPVTITAGADKLSASPRASATNGGSNSVSETAAGKTTQASKTSSAGEVGKPGEAAATSTTGKNAAPAVTQNAVLAGVAAIVGGVLAI
ncbi:hypothetical protein J3458_002151 [Metarhizium acridum]|uniref:GPI anchored cell wall protein n=1 Tax=Metarhizium acridum (strain CQMa 102) TaxID=655827 RepID=E9E943_METAQ|nr:uncharacterized protein MAC_06391 [Metarhizium acridum CQMa 102]EFY87547.1 hypothetical protein MAC_06391 [Metarhizium acridum CQMa 102]KAG8425455.1 hypothetical protein J3458_002151 [Metarhizium acridum]